MRDNEITAAALRAEIGRRRAKIYLLSAQLGVHPATFSAILNERRRLPAELASRALEILERGTVRDEAQL